MKRELAGLSDEALIEVASDNEKGERQSLAADVLFSRYHEIVYRWCRRYTQEHESALDLAQEALLKARINLGRFRGRARFSTWIFAIVRNECISAMRRRRSETDIEELRELLVDPSPGPEVELVEREEQDRLMEMLKDTLSDVELDAIWLRCFERLPVDEITRSLSIKSTSGARGILQNARRKLRKRFQDRQQRGHDS